MVRRPGAGNFQAPSHATMAELSRRPEYSAALEGVLERESVYTTEEYLETLISAGFEADVWETTYSQPLTGEDPVYDWVRGAALRPSLQRLEEADRRTARTCWSATSRSTSASCARPTPPTSPRTGCG